MFARVLRDAGEVIVALAIYKAGVALDLVDACAGPTYVVCATEAVARTVSTVVDRRAAITAFVLLGAFACLDISGVAF